MTGYGQGTRGEEELGLGKGFSGEREDGPSWEEGEFGEVRLGARTDRLGRVISRV
jgi:hypothetical protein